MIKTLESDFGVAYEAWVRHYARVPGTDFPCSLCVVAAGEPGQHGALPAAISSVAVPAQMEWGRWIIKCPFCPSAQLASDTDHKFFCTDCQNAGASGKWLPVAWPANRKVLESLVSIRPRVENRGWLPTQTAKDLAAENAQRGL